jgi:putative MATE family efflux protein
VADRRDLTTGPVAKHLARLGAPMILGIFAVLSVSLADTWFLGQRGTEPLAAISFAFPVVLTLSSLGIGLSAGAASVVSRALGADDGDQVKRLATDSLLLGVAFVLTISVAGWLLTPALFRLLGAEGAIHELIVTYMRIWFFGLPFLVVPMIANGLIRANGDSVAPSAIMITAALVNGGLDPVLIFGLGPIPELGIAGAAWATVIARVITFLASVGVLVFRERLVTLTRPALAVLMRSWKEVLQVGIPAAGSNILNPLGITAVTGLLASYDPETVAAFGVATRLESGLSIPMLALSAAIGPVAGQNWGRRREDRTRRAMRDSFLFDLGWSVLIGLVFLLGADGLVAPFSEEPAVTDTAATYLRLVGFSLAGYGVVIAASAACNAIDRATWGFAFTLLRSGVLYVPLAGLGVLLGPPWMAFAGIAAANVLAGVIVVVGAFRVARRADEGAGEAPAAEAGEARTEAVG